MAAAAAAVLINQWLTKTNAECETNCFNGNLRKKQNSIVRTQHNIPQFGITDIWKTKNKMAARGIYGQGTGELFLS